ncbi:hypothetical protein A0256_00275 [Mucilaginibacter sp. PAMC 26640]|nr:hypothetical protein A0256_00275 [Mucilaginibacter sp. PAMC 26640]
MLREIVQLIAKAQTSAAEGTLFCHGLLIDDEAKRCIEFLEEQAIIENTNYESKLGQTISLELSLPKLNAVGYYHQKADLIRKHKYTYPPDLFYIGELNQFSDAASVPFYTGFALIQHFISTIKSIAKHSYMDVGTEYTLITNDDKAVLLPLNYGVYQIDGLSSQNIDHIRLVIAVFEDSNTEKKFLFINELIDYLSAVTETVRFDTLIRNVSDFTDKCNNAYQYYLRDFSYNKLKIELDSKALEFTQKIQGVINDSQTKLVTIPTAFVLVFAAFDYADLTSVKNVISIISLFIFAVLIQVFLNNQYSSLNFTAANVAAYKETFSQSNIDKFTEKFSLVDNELEKQRGRLCLITWLLWAIPIGLLLTWIVLLINHHPTPR